MMPNVMTPCQKSEVVENNGQRKCGNLLLEKHSHATKERTFTHKLSYRQLNLSPGEKGAHQKLITSGIHMNMRGLVYTLRRQTDGGARQHQWGLHPTAGQGGTEVVDEER